MSSHDRRSDAKKKGGKKNKTSVIYQLICGFFIVRLNLTGKRKKERLSSLSISYIKDGSANTNLQCVYPAVIVYWLNCRTTVSVCERVELWILRCVWVHVISYFVLLPVHVPLCVRAPVYSSMGKLRVCVHVCISVCLCMLEGKRQWK